MKNILTECDTACSRINPSLFIFLVINDDDDDDDDSLLNATLAGLLLNYSGGSYIPY